MAQDRRSPMVAPCNRTGGGGVAQRRAALLARRAHVTTQQRSMVPRASAPQTAQAIAMCAARRRAQPTHAAQCCPPPPPTAFRGVERAQVVGGGAMSASEPMQQRTARAEPTTTTTPPQMPQTQHWSYQQYQQYQQQRRHQATPNIASQAGRRQAPLRQQPPLPPSPPRRRVYSSDGDDDDDGGDDGYDDYAETDSFGAPYGRDGGNDDEGGDDNDDDNDEGGERRSPTLYSSLPPAHVGHRFHGGYAQYDDDYWRSVATRRRQAAEHWADTRARYAKLEQRLAEHGLQRVPMPGDGNCLFHAIASFFGGAGTDHVTVRNKICDYIAANPDRFRVDIECEHESVDKYVANMRRVGTWGDATMLNAFCLAYDTNVVLFSPDGVSELYPSAPDSAGGVVRPKMGLSVCNEHYSATRVVNGDVRQLDDVAATTEAVPRRH